MRVKSFSSPKEGYREMVAWGCGGTENTDLPCECMFREEVGLRPKRKTVPS